MAFADPEKKRAYDRSRLTLPGVKEKRKATFKIWAEKNREHLLAKEAERRVKKRAMVLVATVRTRAKKRGLDFDLDVYTQEIQKRIDAGVCELTGCAFDLSPGRKFNSPSIDRRNPSLGYTYDNIRIVLNLANAALGDWGDDVLREVMTKWLSDGTAMQSLPRSRKPSSKA